MALSLEPFFLYQCFAPGINFVQVRKPSCDTILLQTLGLLFVSKVLCAEKD